MSKYKAGVLVMSDSRHEDIRLDLSGAKIKEILSENGFDVLKYEVISDDLDGIKEKLVKWCDEDRLDLIITSGGTGLSKRDNTPEATLEVIDKEVRGIAEAMRSYSVSITKKGMLSRGVCGIRKDTLIINLPGSLKATKECLDYILPVLDHALGILKGSIHNCGSSS